MSFDSPRCFVCHQAGGDDLMLQPDGDYRHMDCAPDEDAPMTDAERQAGRVAVDLTQFEGHSPAPWLWSGHHDLTDAQGQRVADDGSAYDEYSVVLEPDSPDGRLIAAAPLLLDEVRALRAELSAIRGREGEDGRRLDWLEGYGHQLHAHHLRQHIDVQDDETHARFSYSIDHGKRFDTLRQALDAAMSTTHPSTPEQP